MSVFVGASNMTHIYIQLHMLMYTVLISIL